MQLTKEILEEKLLSLNTYLNTEEEDFVEFIISNMNFSNLEANELKSKEQTVEEARLRIRDNLKIYKKDIENGIRLFIKSALKSEQAMLDEIMQRYLTVSLFQEPGSQTSLPIKDLEFLETIAKRELANCNYSDAGCLFRAIVQMEIIYGPAWVGMAICEQENGALDAASQIYETAMILLPNDYFIRYYAAEFYRFINEKDKAKEILQMTYDDLIKNGMKDSHTFKEIHKLLLNS